MNSDAPLCDCGCGQPVKFDKYKRRWNKYIVNHDKGIVRILAEKSKDPPLCKCGCGQPVTWNNNHRRWNRFINGHAARTPEFQAKCNETKRTPEWRARMGEISRQRAKDKTLKEKAQQARLKTMRTPEFREKTRKRVNEWFSDPENRKKIYEASISPRAKERRSAAMAERIANGDMYHVGKSGYFWSAKTFRYMHFDSTYEWRFLEWADRNKYVIDLATYKFHKVRIPYTHPVTHNTRWYYPDISIMLRNNQTYICEVKPSQLTFDPIVKAKADAAQEFCKKMGYIYIFVTEFTLKILEARPLIKPRF